MPKLNVSETPKILVWILPLANISRGYQEHFSWTHLRRFNCWLFLEVSEALKIPQFKFSEFKYDAHMS